MDTVRIASASFVASDIATCLRARRIDAFADATRALAGWAHASWYASLGLSPGGGAAALMPRHLGAALGVGFAAGAAFEQPAHRLAALPAALLCRVLRARGLLRRRSALRHCVDVRQRRRLAEWVHPVVFDAVVREASDGLHRDAPGMPPAPGAHGYGRPDALAWEGFCLFERDRVWTDPAVLRLLRLGFAVSQPPPAGLVDHPGAADGSAWVLSRLDRFVPEVPWLCG